MQPDWKPQARLLLASGMTVEQVAKIMSKSTVEIEVLTHEKSD